MLKDGTMYQDLGRKHFDRRSNDQQKRSLVKRLADLGYMVELKHPGADSGRDRPGQIGGAGGSADQGFGPGIARRPSWSGDRASSFSAVPSPSGV
jgi:hypothetical protein